MIDFNLDKTLLALYIVVCLVIGYIASRKSSREGFLIADRKIGTLHLAATLSASILGGGALVSMAAFSFEYGIGASWLFISAAIGFFIFPFLIGNKLKPLADVQQFHTLADYFYATYSRRVGLLCAINVFIAFLALLLVQFIAGGKLLAAISGWSYPISVLLMGTVILVYLYLGGFRAVVKTDFFQFLVILALLFVLPFSLNVSTGISPEQYDLFSIGVGQIIGFCIIGLIGILVSADVWQRAIASSSKRTLRNGCLLAGVAMLIFGFTVSVIGISTKIANPNIIPEDALYYGFSNLLPSGVFGLGLIFIIASIMSSADTHLFVTAMNIANDFPKFKNSNQEASVKVTRKAIIGLTAIAVLTAILIDNIIDVIFACVSIALALAPSLIGSFKWKLKEAAVFFSILIGFLSAIGLILAGYIAPETSVISLPVSLVVLLLGQIFLPTEIE